VALPRLSLGGGQYLAKLVQQPATSQQPLLAHRRRWQLVSPASSFHRGGVNVLLADGSVRFIAENVSPDLLHAAGTRTGGAS
jgi:prepilin-type processing-associated H-X9-DG protein